MPGGVTVVVAVVLAFSLAAWQEAMRNKKAKGNERLRIFMSWFQNKHHEKTRNLSCLFVVSNSNDTLDRETKAPTAHSKLSRQRSGRLTAQALFNLSPI